MSIVAYSADILSGSRNKYACHFYYMAKNDCVYGCYITEKKNNKHPSSKGFESYDCRGVY